MVCYENKNLQTLKSICFRYFKYKIYLGKREGVLRARMISAVFIFRVEVVIKWVN
jgi:hypothetical protein